MKGCHGCAVSEAIARGEYTGAVWEDVPCSTCTVAEKGGFAIEYDEEREQQDLGDVREVVPELYDRSVLPVDVMRECVAGILSLPPELRDVVAWRFAGMTYPEIAAVQGVSMAAVEKRHRRAMEIWPGLEALFLEKKVKQTKRRRRHAKRSARCA